ncbi:MAG: hypothetical protein JO201_05710 [Verrucomicrobia bacterium]|nr:hypothetical protein [Verrucomicrobiota bacterium]
MVLLIIEGALRKWVLPGLSDPLLIIRDPVALAIYYFALRARVFPNNVWVLLLAVFGIPSALLTLVTLYSYFPFKAIVLTDIYGFRSNFFHLPLIFVIASALNLEDVKNVGRWTLLLMIPMAVLVALQFQASPDSFINKTAGAGEGLQLTTSGGKIRPPGTFSFISGPVFYLSATMAFLVYGVLNKGVYKRWLLLASAAGLLIGVGVSGSRACVLAVALVVLPIFVIFLIRPSAVNRAGGTLLAIVFLGFIASYLPFFKEGLNVLSDRFVDSAEVAETSIVGGLIERMVHEFTEPFSYIGKIPMTGYGLGLGTAGGAKFLTGTGMILLTENEWGRIIAESGPILGLMFIVWRVSLTGKLLVGSLRALKLGEVLPILLFFCTFLAVLNGQLGQPTTLGFTVVLAGLCLAATNPREETTPGEEEEADQRIEPKPLPRRSVFAERIHRASPRTDHTNGSVDR